MVLGDCAGGLILPSGFVHRYVTPEQGKGLTSLATQSSTTEVKTLLGDSGPVATAVKPAQVGMLHLIIVLTNEQGLPGGLPIQLMSTVNKHKRGCVWPGDALPSSQPPGPVRLLAHGGSPAPDLLTRFPLPALSSSRAVMGGAAPLIQLLGIFIYMPLPHALQSLPVGTRLSMRRVT